MLKQLKSRSGVLFPTIITALICLAIFTFSRLLLVFWQWDRVRASNGLTHILLDGLRVDIASVCYLLILPAFLSCFFLWDNRFGKAWVWLLRFWSVIGLWFVVYMETATVPFILEYDLRPNRLFLEYLIYPKEVLSMLWGGYKLELVVAFLVTLATLFLAWQASGYMTRNLRYQKWQWRPLLAFLVAALGVMGARSTIEHRPLNPALVAYSTDPLMNDLVLNSSYSLLFCAKQMQAEKNAFDYYPNLEKGEIVNEVQSNMNVPPSAFRSAQLPSYAFHPAFGKGKPKNIVILLLESHGAQYVSELGGRNLSPNINNLINEGWAFTRMYATGTRSVRGIEAVISGFSPTPGRAVVKLGKSQAHFFTIADLLKSRGYHTQFIYGGESHFDNMKSFFLGNGFVDMQDLPTFQEPKFIGSWGASDQDLYNHAHNQFVQLQKKNKPFFSLVFSSSNHTPFDYPDNVIEPYNTPKRTLENAVRYADYALGEFIAKAKQSNYWKDTIFVAVADHDDRVSGEQAFPVGHFHIPAVIFGGGVEQKRDNRLASQLDIPPTLLSLAGVAALDPMIGHDLTQKVPGDKQRALMQRGTTFAYMSADNDVVVFHPQQTPETYHYNAPENSLESKAVEQKTVKVAQAHALWGSLVYRDELYKQLYEH
jgi:phosphoglycerol transferase MdoB-like AlkP superfamily enzyme